MEFEIGEPKLLFKMLKLHLDELQYSKIELTTMFGLNVFEFDKLYLQTYSDLYGYLDEDTKVRKLEISY